MSRNLKSILKSIPFGDDARIASQIHDQVSAVHSRMAAIKRKILIMSGKGGVGKSTVTAHLALALAGMGNRVGVLDVDFNGPCLPALLGLTGKTLTFRATKAGGARSAKEGSEGYRADGAMPVEGPRGMKVASLDFLLKNGAPTRWNGPMALSPVWLGALEHSVLRELLADIIWGELDWWLADLPPGAAADKPPALMGFLPDLDGAVMVTTPSALAVDVVRRSVATAREAGIRPLGLVVNMAGRACSHCEHVENLFEDGDSDGGRPETLARELGLPLLGSVPFDSRLSGGSIADKRVPEPFESIARNLVGLLDPLSPS